MRLNKTRMGAAAEQAAVRLLEREGYRVLQRNVRMRCGEIDIVAEEGPTLCFVEVRSRKSAAHGDPLETINAPKQRRIVRAARAYLSGHCCEDREIRFDAVGIVYKPRQRITLIRGAFEQLQCW